MKCCLLFNSDLLCFRSTGTIMSLGEYWIEKVTVKLCESYDYVIVELRLVNVCNKILGFVSL